MKATLMLAATLVAFTAGARAAEVYDSYDVFYAAQPGAVFGDPIKHDAGAAYSYPGESGLHTERRATLGASAVRIDLAPDRITVNDKTYRFARAIAFQGEYASDIHPASAKVLTAPKVKGRPAVLCVEGGSNGSGESDRHRQIYLLVNPLASKGKATFLHLPSLLSSCRAVLATKDGRLVFPKNSYLFDDAQETRVGLLMSYYTFENRRFVPALNAIRLRFTRPEIPFQFSVEEKD
ncbi:conserved exported protein of unknown function [Burkholderia multivorans]